MDICVWGDVSVLLIMMLFLILISVVVEPDIIIIIKIMMMMQGGTSDLRAWLGLPHPTEPHQGIHDYNYHDDHDDDDYDAHHCAYHKGDKWWW